jgi:hypothetical protein
MGGKEAHPMFCAFVPSDWVSRHSAWILRGMLVQVISPRFANSCVALHRRPPFQAWFCNQGTTFLLTKSSFSHHVQVPVSIADLGGTEIDLRFSNPAQGNISVVVAPILRFADCECSSSGVPSLYSWNQLPRLTRLLLVLKKLGSHGQSNQLKDIGM